MTPHLSIIIPAYNESSRITATLRSIDAYSKTVDYSMEVLVVINNTTDSTVAVVSALQIEMPYLRMVDIGMHESENGTKGLAVRHGMLAAQGTYCLFMDADNATQIQEIEKFWQYFNQGHSVVYGSRYAKGAHTHRVWYRNIMGKLSNLLVQALLLPGVRDTQCGFKCFTNEAAEAVFGKSVLSGWGFDMEILMIAKKMHYKMREVPIVWNEIGKSTVKASAFLYTLRDLIRIRRMFN